MSSLWSKFNEPDLARFVSREASRLIVLPDEARASVGVPERRRELVGALYHELATARIRYAPERYHPDATQQEIRTAHEVLDAPRLATCLDLAVLLCGACLDFDLLPVLVVLDGHALAAVSLRHGRREWNDYGRPELADFEEGPLHDGDRIRQLVDSGQYLAVECTGFAVADDLPDTLPEGRGRERGLLTFDRAVQAGREQLAVPERGLRFAIDIAVAHDHWGMTPPRLGSLEAMAFTHVVQDLLPTAGMIARRVEERREVVPLPRVTPRLPSGPPLIDRHEEVGLAVATAPGGPLVLHGPVGSGRTSVLHAVARDDRLTPGDGVAVVAGRGLGVRDLLQEVFDSFFEDPAGAQRSRAWLARHLAGLRGVVAIDDSGLTSDELAEVLVPLSACAVVVTGEQAPMLASGRTIRLPGLPLADGVALLCRVIGRELDADEVAAAEVLCQRLDGHPGRLVLAGARVRDEGADLVSLSASVSDPADVAAGLYAALPAAAKDVVRALLALSGGPVAHAQAVAVAGAGDDPPLRDLLTRHLVSASSPRYVLDATLARDLGGRVREASADTIVEHYRAHTALHRDRPEALLDDVDVLLDVARMAAAAGRHRAVVDIARNSDVVLAGAGRLDALHALLRLARDSAHAMGDQDAVAWALHQAGSLDLGLEAHASARELLEDALAVRQQLGDEAAVAATRNNLDVLRSLAPEVFETDGTEPTETTELRGRHDDVTRPLPPVEPPPREDRELRAAAGPPPRRWSRVLVALTVVVVGAVLAWLWWRSRPEPPPPSGTVTVQPSQLDFGAAVVDGQAVVQAVTLDNPTDTDVAIIEEIAGADPGDFRLESGCGPQLAAGDACDLAVAFAPTSPGDRSARLRVVVTGAEERELDVDMTGRGVEAGEALPRVDPPVVDVGDVRVGSTVERELAVANDGDATAQVVSVVVDVDVDVVEDGCSGVELAGGTSCPVAIAVTPQSAGPLESSLVVGFEGLDDLTAAVIGVGTEPDLEVDPDTLRLPTSRTPGAAVAVANVGTATLTVEAVRLEGDVDVFDILTRCDTRLDPGMQCGIEAIYRGFEAGQSATVVIVSDDPDGDARVVLEGIPGVAPKVSSPDPADRQDDPSTDLPDGRWLVPVEFDRPIAEDTLRADTNVRMVDTQGFPVPVDVEVVDATTVRVVTREPYDQESVTLLIDGDGDAPVLGEDGVPLDGDADDRPGGDYSRELGPPVPIVE
jgi:hypothetical protein